MGPTEISDDDVKNSSIPAGDDDSGTLGIEELADFMHGSATFGVGPQFNSEEDGMGERAKDSERLIALKREKPQSVLRSAIKRRQQ